MINLPCFIMQSTRRSSIKFNKNDFNNVGIEIISKNHDKKKNASKFLDDTSSNFSTGQSKNDDSIFNINMSNNLGELDTNNNDFLTNESSYHKKSFDIEFQ